MTSGETSVVLAGMCLVVLLTALKHWLEARDRPRPKRSLSSWSSVLALGVAILTSGAASVVLGGYAIYNAVRQVDLMRSGVETTGVVERKWQGGRGQGRVVAYRFGNLRGSDRTWADTYKSAKIGEPINVYYSSARPQWNALERWSFLNSALYTLFWSLMTGALALLLYREHLPVAWGDMPGPCVDPNRVRRQ